MASISFYRVADQVIGNGCTILTAYGCTDAMFSYVVYIYRDIYKRLFTLVNS